MSQIFFLKLVHILMQTHKTTACVGALEEYGLINKQLQYFHIASENWSNTEESRKHCCMSSTWYFLFSVFIALYIYKVLIELLRVSSHSFSESHTTALLFDTYKLLFWFQFIIKSLMAPNSGMFSCYSTYTTDL